MTRIYGAHGADCFAELVIDRRGDLIRMYIPMPTFEMTPGEAVRLAEALKDEARDAGWRDPEDDDGR